MVVLAYGVLCALMNWRNGGGVIPMLFATMAIGFVWRSVMRSKIGVSSKHENRIQKAEEPTSHEIAKPSNQEMVYKYAAFRAQMTGPIFDEAILPYSKSELQSAFEAYQTEVKAKSKVIPSAAAELQEVQSVAQTLNSFKEIDTEDRQIVMQINGSPRFHRFRGGPVDDPESLTDEEKQSYEVFQKYFRKYRLEAGVE